MRCEDVRDRWKAAVEWVAELFNWWRGHGSTKVSVPHAPERAPPLIEALTRIPINWKAPLLAVSVQVSAVAIPYPELLSNHFPPHAKPRGLEQSRYSTRLGAGCGREANRKDEALRKKRVGAREDSAESG
jgi:hypothetical protein